MDFCNNSRQLLQLYLRAQYPASGACLDATAGNGHDTLLLTQFTSGPVFAFDIQEPALDATRMLLAKNSVDMSRVSLILDGHQNLPGYVSGPLQLAVFNLGYLPGGDKTITTNSQETIMALKAVFSLLVPGGFVFITLYPGHEAGRQEKLEILEFLSSLPQKDYTVIHHCFINQYSHPPELICVEKRV